MDLFQQRLLAEGIRAVESDSPALATYPVENTADDFEKSLLQRAIQLDGQLQLGTLFAHFATATKRIFTLLSLLLLLLGASSVQQLFFSEQGTQINFFWAFALFFVPNLLSLFLWGLFFLQPALLSNGWLARLTLFLLTKFEKRFNPQAKQHPHFWITFKCYFKISFSAQLGRYQLSVLTHLLWLSYFCGAAIMLVLMLATHQVDFIWQTSILTQAHFQWLTELLAYIPNLLGFPVPNLEQVLQSHLGAINVIDDAQSSRMAWSSLLISSLVIYGLAPRLLLLLLMLFLLKKGQTQFGLNLTQPYYVQLRQLLKPNVTSLGICDADTSLANPSTPSHWQAISQQLPRCFYPVAIELSASQLQACKAHIKQHSPAQRALLTHICDFHSQQYLLKEIVNIEPQALLLYVALSRLPDRGLLGFIKSLTGLTANPVYLLLIDDMQSESCNLNKRRSDWYALAEQAAIPLDNIVQFKVNLQAEA